MNELKEITIKLKNQEDYIIIKDILRDKNYVSGSDDSPDRYYFYFQDTFKMYNIDFDVSYHDYKSYEEGTLFYLIIKRDNKHFEGFYSSKEYKLTYDQEKRLIDASEIPQYTKIQKYEREVKEQQVVLNKEFLTQDVYHKKLIMTFAIISLALISANYIVFNKSNELLIPLVIIGGIVSLIALIIFIINARRKNAILKGNYRIVKDRVDKINETISFRQTNDMIEFTMNKTGINVIQSYGYYGNVKVGDELYLVFLNNKAKPTRVYIAKNTMVELNVE